LLALLVICVLGTVILSIPGVQTRLARMVTNRINSDFGTNINIDRVRISLITWDTALDGIYVEDYRQDTLVYIDRLSTSILSLRDVVGGTLEFGDIEIDSLFLNMKTYRDAPDTNLGIFIDKLDDGQPRAPGTPPFYFYASGVEIDRSRFLLSDDNLENPVILDFNKLEIALYPAENTLIIGRKSPYQLAIFNSYFPIDTFENPNDMGGV